MQSHHWLLLLIVFVVGVVFARLMPQLPQAVGLP
jgi:hypothetical protein